MKRYGVVLIFVAILIFALFQFDAKPGNELAVHVLDVGDADAIFIQLPDGKNMLIDAAEAKDGPDVVAYLKQHNVKHLDVVIATHPHSDHIGGLPDVLAAFSVDTLYLPNAVHTTKAFELLLENAEAREIETVQAKAGVSVFTGEYTAKFLGPLSDTYDSLNDYSAVLQMSYGSKTFLFGGDAEKLAEKELVNTYGRALQSDVLKVCHHGSETSSCNAFLDAVQPEIALISGGGKMGKHNNPDKKVINRLEKRGIDIRRTDTDGTLVLRTDGKEWK